MDSVIGSVLSNFSNFYRGSGKTRYLQSCIQILRENYCRMQMHLEIEYLDCREESENDGHGSNISTIENIARNLRVSEAGNQRGRLVILDNLDILCPYVADQETFLKDPQKALTSDLVAKRLEHILISCYLSNSRSHRRASAVLKVFREYFSDEDEMDAEIVSSALRDLVVSTATCGSVFVIASCQSASSLNPRLMHLLNLRKLMHVPELDISNRYNLLSSYLTSLGLPLRSSSEEKLARVVGSVIEGMTPREIEAIASRVAIVSSRRHFEDQVSTKSAENGLYSTLDEILECTSVQNPEIHTSLSSSRVDLPWNDICGLTVAKQKILSVMHNPVIFRRLMSMQPIKMSKAILLFGPPGNGKTVLARATAQKCGLAFISVKGPELLNKYIGASEKAVRDVFYKANSIGRPCLIFFDEFEAIASKRGKDNSGVTDRVVNQLLTFLDGVEEVNGNDGNKSQIFLMASTSRPDLIDPALLRPGRVETHVYIGPPETTEDRMLLMTKMLAFCGGSHDKPDDRETLLLLEEICSHKHSSKLSAADLKGVVTSAYLAAVNAFLSKEKGEKRADRLEVGIVIRFESGGRSISISKKILWNVFLSTRPSVNEEEMEFYNSINAQFRGK